MHDNILIGSNDFDDFKVQELYILYEAQSNDAELENQARDHSDLLQHPIEITNVKLLSDQFKDQTSILDGQKIYVLKRLAKNQTKTDNPSIVYNPIDSYPNELSNFYTITKIDNLYDPCNADTVKINQTPWFKGLVESAENLAIMQNILHYLDVAFLFGTVYAVPYIALPALAMSLLKMTYLGTFFEYKPLKAAFDYKTSMEKIVFGDSPTPFYNSLEYQIWTTLADISIGDIAVTIAWTRYGFEYNKYMYHKFFAKETASTQIKLALHLAISQNIIDNRIIDGFINGEGLEALPNLAKISSTAAKRLGKVFTSFVFGKYEHFIPILVMERFVGEVVQELHDGPSVNGNISYALSNLRVKSSSLLDEAIASTITKDYALPNWHTDAVQAHMRHTVNTIIKYTYATIKPIIADPNIMYFSILFMSLLIRYRGILRTYTKSSNSNYI